MLAYIVRRIALLVIVALGVTILTFIMMHLAPGDPAEMIAIARYGLENLTVENVENIRIIEGFDSSVGIQYLHWLNHILRGDFGNSLVTGDPVWEEIIVRVPATLKLSLAALMLSLLIAIPAGIISAAKQYSAGGNDGRIGGLTFATG